MANKTQSTPAPTTGTPAKTFDITKETLQLLMEIGYLGAQNYMPDLSERVFIGIIAVRPKSELPFIGLALCAMAKSNYYLAAYILGKKALPLNPHSSHVKNFLSLALGKTGYSHQAMQLIEEVIREAKDPKEVEFAKSIMVELKKRL